MPRIVEFDSDPESSPINGRLEIRWYSKTAVDLDWVAGAKPYTADAASIVLAGSNHWFSIRIAYPDFMALWRQPKGDKT